MRLLALGLWVVARSLSGQLADPTAAQQAKLNAAIRAVRALNDDEARTLLHDLLATGPAERIAAQAYLYLGVIDFNALDFGHGREELRHALELDSTLEIPPSISPKIVLAFAEIRQKLIRKMSSGAQPAPAVAPVAAPAASTDAPLVVFNDQPARSSAWPWLFGVATALAIGVGSWGWAQVASFESLRGSSSPTDRLPEAQVVSAQGSASVGEAVGIASAVAAAGLATGLALTW
jgi:hypothetical protein